MHPQQRFHLPQQQMFHLLHLGLRILQLLVILQKENNSMGKRRVRTVPSIFLVLVNLAYQERMVVSVNTFIGKDVPSL